MKVLSLFVNCNVRIGHICLLRVLKGFPKEEAKQNLSYITLCRLSLFTSRCKKRIISLNLLLERVPLKIRHPQVVSHKLSTGRPLCHKILAITISINLSTLSIVTFQFILPETLWASVTVEFLMFLTVALPNKTQKGDCSQ